MFAGSIPALITPFENGLFAESTFRKMISWHIEQGSKGLVPCGTTGESPTMDHPEHERVIEVCVDEAAGRVPVIAGTGSNSTNEAIGLTKAAEKAGADAALVVTPYYNKPSQEGMFQHFKAICDATDIPIFIYNIPGRSVVDMTVETITRCYNELENIVGIKDATGNLARVPLQRMSSGKDFIQLSGEDQTALAFNAHGGRGCISVTANIAPKLVAEFQDATLNGDYVRALEIQDKLTALHDVMFIEPSPGPVKYAAKLLGLCSDEMRLPLTPITKETEIKVKEAMATAGLLS
ncbi:4-hydroxy-tetrahydrodipicolinate synthase [Pseudemcibacter aquimaris]|uniref:4-hydroxy-tetrahydrodipicolinate synthase n=1 Tax=Pseudemcibacter aquimaris TaxID=2857064 RepID=UPI002013B8EB|nr:4-hydroxy-tetrahydrodipicolinate synthase [Pseudemcibacter aquimaris]MCC3861033.1 4-hydroxy-tetrahydrodipicolinate synthase [Pseudemcibacter aquimaris]WDU59851.1 4-hydroxy-tetrahydrodipicolinate synthase [Pseudemcibacter aquimaris]